MADAPRSFVHTHSQNLVNSIRVGLKPALRKASEKTDGMGVIKARKWKKEGLLYHSRGAVFQVLVHEILEFMKSVVNF